MKKLIIIISSIIVLATAGFFVWNYFSSFRNINFIVNEPGLAVDIYSSKDTSVISLTSGSTTLSLRDGDYYYKIDNEKNGLINQDFKIDKTVSEITINPNYSSAYLNSQLIIEKTEILSIINNTYPAFINNYVISNEQLFAKGEWFGANITRKTQIGDITDPYKVILNKQDGKWSLVHYPEIVVTKYLFPDVPIDILNSINQL